MSMSPECRAAHQTARDERPVSWPQDASSQSVSLQEGALAGAGLPSLWRSNSAAGLPPPHTGAASQPLSQPSLPSGVLGDGGLAADGLHVGGGGGGGLPGWPSHPQAPELLCLGGSGGFPPSGLPPVRPPSAGALNSVHPVGSHDARLQHLAADPALMQAARASGSGLAGAGSVSLHGGSMHGGSGVLRAQSGVLHAGSSDMGGASSGGVHAGSMHAGSMHGGSGMLHAHSGSLHAYSGTLPSASSMQHQPSDASSMRASSWNFGVSSDGGAPGLRRFSSQSSGAGFAGSGHLLLPGGSLRAMSGVYGQGSSRYSSGQIDEDQLADRSCLGPVEPICARDLASDLLLPLHGSRRTAT